VSRGAAIICPVILPINKPLYAISKALLIAGGKLMFRLRHEGVENVPREGGLIIASNHQSHLDPPMIGVGVPRHIHFMAKRELAKNPLLGWFMRQVGTILVDRSQGRGALESALACLEEGGTVVIFPEGTRTRSGRLNQGRKGVAVIAHRSGAAVLPTCIAGANKCFPVGSKTIKPGRIKVRFAKPMKFAHYPEGTIPESVLAETTKNIMDAIEELAPPEMRPLPEEKAKWYREEGAA